MTEKRNVLEITRQRNNDDVMIEDSIKIAQ